MFENLVKNRFWFWKAMETYGLGIYFIIKHNTFAFVPPQPTLLDVLDDPPAIFILACVGTLGLVYSLWDIQLPYYKPLMTGALTFVWAFFMIAFAAHDFATARYVSFESMYALAILVTMVHEQIVGG
ncbi:hypothetical protein LG347_02435 [Lactiplantibacillus plantarum]|uniref:hypothetical protein n=1 Tax=Lactiplantibacillus plantarum TaxID=1590 RepID=UPI0007E4B6AC|nr:hypothetical protein [Lactiplantibacillus plantarum]ANI95791.1 hypothetical protein A9F05_09495 [Lactiplantibacillus plantarum]AYG27261.1 hypothetical protein CFI62_04375 [Lactiplantibacillus plantarum]MCB7139911.1 hypothetical protein [Lactiplantibacillus plantarum]MCB7157389.1 hypothetical protein [Lactiplantibacillus plantarum]MCB7167755.1 hypothetical protein [Lactiplantibacillus plantarum]